MNPQDPKTFFEVWLTAYSDRLHLVKRGSPIDLMQRDSRNAKLSVSSEKSGDAASIPRKPTRA